MRKNWDNNILEVFFLSWIGVLVFLELTTPRWVVAVALMFMAVFLVLLTFIPRDTAPYVHRPRSVLFTRCVALLLFLIAAWIRYQGS